MTLTLFVGTLTDYFAAALRRSPDTAAAMPSRAAVRERIAAWRDWISEGLVGNGHLASPLDWSEDEQPAYRHALGKAPLAALRFLLVHGPDDGAPPLELPAEFEKHPRWVAAVADDFEQTGFDQVLVPELWLPARFELTFECPYPDGHEVQAGSLGALRSQLADVGKKRLQVAAADRERQLAQTPGDTRDLLELASFALVAFDAASCEAHERRLPMLLHW